MTKLVFSVEDVEEIREIVSCAMEASGMEVETFPESSYMLERLEKRRPDIILLDIMLPNMDGIETLAILKESKFASIPVIMLSAKDTEFDKVALLNLGADDYITKPFGVLELIARVKVNLKHNHSTIIERNNFIINDAKHEIYYKGDLLELTKKEYSTLKLLICCDNKPVTKDELLSAVWGDNYEGESRTLNMVILRLRAKIGDNTIETVRGVGFRLRN